MKTFKIILILLMFSMLPARSYSSTLGYLHISLIEGDVQINTEDTHEWVAASINMPLRDRDRIWVPEGGRVELQLWDGTCVRLNESSSLDVLTIERDAFQFYLNSGHAYINFRGLKDTLLQIDTPVSSIQAYEKSEFRVDVSDEDSTEISVFKGVVYAENRNGRTTVRERNTLSLTGYSYADLHPLGPPDNWERWNKERDRRLYGRSYSSRYLPDELSSYSYDFDTHGKWAYVRDYGYCWTPTVIVSIGWAPYRLGRWVWIEGDYVWVSYEAWGWVPYHYGRWIYRATIGWCWVPPARRTIYWGPGYVGWVYTPAYVAWIPLAPGEIYYGYGYYGPYSVNIINININRIKIKNVYKHVHVSNAITIVNSDTFVTGKPATIRVKENPFLRERISIGRPDIKPGKRTTMPAIKEIPQTKQPPPLIRDIQVKDLKERHPLLKERGDIFQKPEPLPKTKAVRPKKVTPGEKPEKQKKITPIEKMPGKPGELKPPGEKGKERSRVLKPPVDIGGKPRELRPPAESGIEKSREKMLPAESRIERSKGHQPTERSKSPKEMKPAEREAKKSKENKPTGKEAVRPDETKGSF